MNPKTKTQTLEVSFANDDVGAALGLLREALGGEEKRIRWEGSQAMAHGDYETAKMVIDFAEHLLAFTDKVEKLGKEWQSIEQLRDHATPEVQQIVSKHFFGRQTKGEVTPQAAFERPILEALVAMGGSGRTKKVLNRVGFAMKTVLKPIDYEPHKSEQIRWRNTAQWARNDMANHSGLMKSDSPNGYWEISDKGRAWLKNVGSFTAPPAPSSNLIKELDPKQPHTLTEDFRFKRPCGFVLDGKSYQDLATWSRVYELTLLQLAKANPTLFKALPDNPATVTKRGNPYFSRKPANLRQSLTLPGGIYAETNLSANHICAAICNILNIFSIPHTSCTIFLRQDRDA